MVGLTSFEVYNFVPNVIEEINKFEIYADIFDNTSFTELKDQPEEILEISNITPDYMQNKIKGPRLISAKKKLETETRRTDGYIILLLGYARSPFRDFDIRIVEYLTIQIKFCHL